MVEKSKEGWMTSAEKGSLFRANILFLMPDYEDEFFFSLMHTIESFTMRLTVIRVDF